VCLYLIEYDLSYEPLKSVKDQVVAGFTVGRSIDQNINESCNLVSIHPWKLFVDGEKPSAQYIGLICDESLTYRILHSNTGHFGSFIFILVSCGESCLIVSCCVGDRWGMVAAMRIVTGVGNLVQRTGDGQAQVGYSMAKRSRGRMTLCVWSVPCT
jgi:hypothetical protein